MAEPDRHRFEAAAAAGPENPGALTSALRRTLDGRELQAVAAMAVHVAAAAPDKMISIYDAAAAGWLGGEAPARPQQPPAALPI